MTRLADPLLLLAAILIVGRVAFVVWSHRRRAGAFPFSSIRAARGGSGLVRWTASLPLLLELGGSLLLLWALARPQEVTRVSTDRFGIDLVIVLDASGSMGAVDFQPRNRFEVAREMITEFVSGRTNDRIGIVTFGTRAATRTPVTWDHAVVRNVLSEVQIGDNGDGTAIGLAIATAINRLRTSSSSSRVMVLVTDGVNNAGAVDPLTAAAVAAKLGIRIYTIGVGSSGIVPVPIRMQNRLTGEIETVFRPARVEIDEESLASIADMTGGSYFRATDPDALRQVLERIDALEKQRLSAPPRETVEELYLPWLLTGLALITAALILGESRWMRLTA